VFGDLEGVKYIFAIFSKAVFDRCVKVNLKLNANKHKFLCPELPWIGHVISFQQLKPDPAKVSAIKAIVRNGELFSKVL
jgi:hypothetical protein